MGKVKKEKNIYEEKEYGESDYEAYDYYEENSYYEEHDDNEIYSSIDLSIFYEEKVEDHHYIE